MAANQPSNIEPYLQPGNAATRNPLEQNATEKLHHHDGPSSSSTAATSRQSQSQNGVPTSSGHGVHGSGPVDDLEARATSVGDSEGQSQGQDHLHLENDSVNAEQMATLAEGKVAGAVDRKSGTQQARGSGPAEEQDFASELDRKKAEQAGARDAVKAAKSQGADVGGTDGQSRALGTESLADA